MSESVFVRESAESIGTFRPGELLGLNCPQPDGIDYLGQDATVFKTIEDGGAARYDFASRQRPLNGQEFMGLLDTVAPAGDGRLYLRRIYGTITDWDVVEGDDSFSTSLVKLHEHLGNPWHEFVSSQPAFIGMLRDVQLPALRSFGIEELATKEGAKMYGDAARMVVKRAARSREALAQTCAELEIDIDVEGIVLRNIAGQLSRGKGKRNRIYPSNQNTPELWRRYGSWNEDKKEKLLWGIFQNLPSVRLSRILDGDKALDILYDMLRVDGEDYVYQKEYLAPGATLEQAYANRQQHRLGKYTLEVMEVPDPAVNKINKIAVPGSIKREDPYDRMIPLLSWRRHQDTRREFVIDRNHTESSSTTYHDGIAGVLLAAYLAPEVRDTWPNSMSIQDRRQRMAAAQVPVLALMRQQQLLDSDLISKLESLDVAT